MNGHLGLVLNESSASNLSRCFHDDNWFKYRAYTFTYVLLFPVAFITNLCAVTVFTLQRKQRTAPSSVVMMNLAVSDLCFSLTLPLRLVYYFRQGIWDYPDWLCRLCVYGFYLNLYTSILFLTLLSVLRWLAVAQPLRHHTLATPTRILLVCLGIWVFVGGASSFFLAQGVVHRGGVPRCFEPQKPSTWYLVLVLNYVALLFGFLVPFSVIVCSYGFIVRRLTSRPASFSERLKPHPPAPRRGSGGGGGECGRRRSLSLVSAVIVTFLLCFLPYHAARSLHLHAVCGGWGCRAVVTLQRLVVVTLCLAASNSVINPLLYYYCTQSFRDQLSRAGSRISARSRSLH
ncbi:cysteinyl leukotriene receptor 2 [Periophthalmus magnuspinnatus]|uniref:cysteinyl leukotriene receptor 2 n=1 Tax=Periophthalmus magnuspinnatus TaxID=409849 RepID=UPI00145B647A|nr:cysteinyl leukotriene receptor 2 [Periophthalmus magnuspinnatus]